MSFFERLQKETESQRQWLFQAPVINKAFSGDISLEDYTNFLTQAYHHVKHTVPLLMASGAKLSISKTWLQPAFAEYIEEEQGHDEWILNDLVACGCDREERRNSEPWFSTEMLVSYAYDVISRGNPMGFFGMVHVLEGTSVSIASQVADVIQEKLGLPNKAFTYLRSHGALDLEHVKFFEELMNKVDDPDDQKAIIDAAKRFYFLYGSILYQLTDVGHPATTDMNSLAA